MAIDLTDLAGLLVWGAIAVIAWCAALAVGRWLASVEVPDSAPRPRAAPGSGTPRATH
jgi:hypothetical protein